MGKASRWLWGLLGMKKERERAENPISSDTTTRERKRWSFARSTTAGGTDVQTQTQTPGESSRLRSYDQRQSMHAIAVAAATAAAADAAVAAAHAAVAVVRLTSQGRGIMYAAGGIDTLTLAAIKIQSIYRGHLARKARRALKSLVRIQALVRGFLVRKRTAAVLYSMQALIRAQASVRSQRVHHRRIKKSHRSSQERQHYDEFHSKRLSAHQVLDESPKIVEMDTSRPRSRSRRIQTVTAPIDEEMYYHYYFPTVSTPLPGRHSVPDGVPRNLQEWSEYRRGVSTAQSTPRLSNSHRSNGLSTPAKSVSGGDSSLYREDSEFPNYMMSTESFCAKLRSHSVPRQRPEMAAAAGSGGGGSSKRRMSLKEIMRSRNSFSGVRMNKSCAEFNEDLV